jgi:hypothetical protein
MRLALLVVASLSACNFRHGSLGGGPDDAPVDDALTDARPIDAPSDARPDATPDARVCPVAPGGCTRFTCDGSSSCYYICSGTKRSWANAKTACESITSGATAACIATINNQSEQDCIVTATNPSFPSSNWIWFGFRQNANATEPAGNWAWECGTSGFTGPGWGAGEPNNSGGNEDCAALTNGGGWFDASCDDSARYLCELP